ncbi:MAG: hypothetical protein IKV85_06800 [Ruminococcus sp.]|nr:hypothetical protein [Ruminococcus sp.]
MAIIDGYPATSFDAKNRAWVKAVAHNSAGEVLPDTTEASAGDVLTLNEDGEAVWTNPSGGGGQFIFTEVIPVYGGQATFSANTIGGSVDAYSNYLDDPLPDFFNMADSIIYELYAGTESSVYYGTLMTQPTLDNDDTGSYLSFMMSLTYFTTILASTSVDLSNMDFYIKATFIMSEMPEEE